MALAYWQLFEALWRGAAPFRRREPEHARDDTPIAVCFRALLETRVTLPRGVHVEKFVTEELIPLVDMSAVPITAREIRVLVGWPQAVASFVRELKRTAAGLREISELSTEGRDALIRAVFNGLTDGVTPWIEALLTPLTTTDADDPPDIRQLLSEGGHPIAILERWFLELDGDDMGWGWRTRATTMSGEELTTGMHRGPQRPGLRRERALRPGERALLDDITADLADDGPREVYADWLTERGDPRGELILLQLHRRRRTQTAEQAARERELLERHGVEWTGGSARWWLDWQGGFVEGARFSCTDTRDEDQALWAFLSRVETCALRRLEIDCQTYVAPVLSALLRSRWESLEELTIDWRGANHWDRFQINEGEAGRLCTNTPRLRVLRLIGDRLLPELHHENLQELRVRGNPTIAGCGIEHRWKSEGVRLPRLHTLGLRFTEPVTADQLGLGADRVPALRHLAIHGVTADRDTTALSWIAAWPGAPRLDTIAVSQVDGADEPHLEMIAERLAGARWVVVDKLAGPPSFLARLQELVPQLRAAP